MAEKVEVFRRVSGVFRKVVIKTDGEGGEGLDRDGRAWRKGEDGETWERVFGEFTSSERKRAYQLRRNVEAFTGHYLHEMCGFMTTTAESKDMSPKEFAAIWDDIRKNHVRWIRSYIRVLEPQKRGTPHHHSLVATPWDLRPSDFDWLALQGSCEARKAGDLDKARELTKQYSRSATPELRGAWSELREVCKRYGLGRSEFLPFRKESAAVANYVGKYLESGLAFRRDDWKGVRRVEFDRKESRQWRACSASFSWVSPGARQWRERVGELAKACAAADLGELTTRLGRRWAYELRGKILTMGEDEWRRYLVGCARDHGGDVEKKAMITVGGQVLAWYPSMGEMSGGDES